MIRGSTSSDHVPRRGWQSPSSITRPCPNIAPTFIVFGVHPGSTQNLLLYLTPATISVTALKTNKHQSTSNFWGSLCTGTVHIFPCYFWCFPLRVFPLEEIQFFISETRFRNTSVLFFSPGFDWHYQLNSENACLCVNKRVCRLVPLKKVAILILYYIVKPWKVINKSFCHLENAQISASYTWHL